MKLRGRDIDGEGEVLGQLRGGGEDSVEKVFEERIDEIGLLSEGYELSGGDDAADRVVPTRENLKACELASAQLDERLEVWDDLLTAVDCSAEIGFSVDGHIRRIVTAFGSFPQQ